MSEALNESTAHSKCVTCGEFLATPEDAANHRQQTFGERKNEQGYSASHQTRTINPTEDEQLAAKIHRIIDNAIEEAVDEIGEILYNNKDSHKVINDAMKGYSDFEEAWEEYINDGI